MPLRLGDKVVIGPSSAPLLEGVVTEIDRDNGVAFVKGRGEKYRLSLHGITKKEESDSEGGENGV